MEFLIVHAKERGRDTVLTGIPVLINGEANGTTGSMIKLDAGAIEVSVDAFKAETVTVKLLNTTYETPAEVVVLYGLVLPPEPQHDFDNQVGV